MCVVQPIRPTSAILADILDHHFIISKITARTGGDIFLTTRISCSRSANRILSSKRMVHVKTKPKRATIIMVVHLSRAYLAVVREGGIRSLLSDDDWVFNRGTTIEVVFFGFNLQVACEESVEKQGRRRRSQPDIIRRIDLADIIHIRAQSTRQSEGAIFRSCGCAGCDSYARRTIGITDAIESQSNVSDRRIHVISDMELNCI